MRGREMWVGTFVDFDDDQTHDEAEYACEIQDCMNIRALFLLSGCVGWLEDQDGLCHQKDTGRIEKLETPVSENVIDSIHVTSYRMG